MSFSNTYAVGWPDQQHMLAIASSCHHGTAGGGSGLGTSKQGEPTTPVKAIAGKLCDNDTYEGHGVRGNLMLYTLPANMCIALDLRIYFTHRDVR